MEKLLYGARQTQLYNEISQKMQAEGKDVRVISEPDETGKLFYITQSGRNLFELHRRVAMVMESEAVVKEQESQTTASSSER